MPPTRSLRLLARSLQDYAHREQPDTTTTTEAITMTTTTKRAVARRSTSKRESATVAAADAHARSSDVPAQRKQPRAAQRTSVKVEQSAAASPPRRRRKSVPVKKEESASDVGDVEDLVPSEVVVPPADWEELYNLIKAQRKAGPVAPVDTMGCDMHVLAPVPPAVGRLHNLVSLVLSSQTKDTVNGAAMHRLKTQLPGGLTVQSLLDCPPAQLDRLIYPVGFHNRKTIYLQQIAAILRADYADDIPRTLDGLLALPGVGPKMAYLCIASAWGDVQGIGVDVHVHRICNMLGWTSSPPHTAKTNTPEQTRLALQSWLPRDRWNEINHLLVGLGQTVCLPRGRRCWECKAGLAGKCPAALEGADEGRPPTGYKGRRTVSVVETELKEEDEPDLDLSVHDRGAMSGNVKLEVTEEVTIKAESADTGHDGVDNLRVASPYFGR